MTNVADEIIKYEKEIVWLEDLTDKPWVREKCGDFVTKEGIPEARRLDITCGNKIIVGYANLKDNAPHGFINPDTGDKHYYRRFFILNRDDYKNYYGSNNSPIEAVDPLFIEAKKHGLHPKKKHRYQ